MRPCALPRARRPAGVLPRLAALALAAAAACASHQKSADRAAAVGDWKTAEREYAAALKGDPGSAELRSKHESARANALATALAQSRACAAAEDWECALGESSYALALDPADADLARFRRDAARAAGLLRVRKAGDASRRRDWAAGLALLHQARDATDDPGVAAEADRLRPALVRGAVDEADRLRQERQYAQAVALLELASAADGTVRPRLDAARAEQEQFAAAEYDRLARAGDALLAERRFAEAQASYESALRFRKGGRAATLARYASECRAGEAAVRSRDFERAASAFGAAVNLGVERDGFAARELERVRLRRYSLQLRSVLVRPSRPDGRPWVGERTRTFDAVMVGMRGVESGILGGASGRAVRTAIDVANAIPPENQPTVVVVLDVAGRRLATLPRRALYVAPGASLVVTTNHHDDRALTIRVVHQDGTRPHDVGAVTVALGELVERREVALGDRSIARLELLATPTDAPEGTAANLVAEGATASTVPAPRPAR